MDQSSRRNGSQDICGTRRRLIPFYQNTGNGKRRDYLVTLHIVGVYPIHSATIARTRLRCRRRRRKKAFGRGNARRNLNNTPQLACALWRARMFSRLFRRRASIIASKKLCQGGERSQAGKKRIHLSIRPCRGFSLFTSRCAAVQRRSRRPAKSPCPPEATGTVMGMTARRA